jgi:hypothetical protein
LLGGAQRYNYAESIGLLPKRDYGSTVVRGRPLGIIHHSA